MADAFSHETIVLAHMPDKFGARLPINNESVGVILHQREINIC